MNVNVGWNLTKEEKAGDSEYVYAYHRLLEPILKAF